MLISELIAKMTAFLSENSGDYLLHDTAHFMKVWGFARTIGELEQLPPDAQFVTEAAAVLHDIACPYCRQTFGSTVSRLQEKEGGRIAALFLAGTDIPPALQERIIYLVSHHHTTAGVDGADWQILLEADYLVNADEHRYTPEAITAFRDRVCRTESGTALLNTLYLKD